MRGTMEGGGMGLYGSLGGGGGCVCDKKYQHGLGFKHCKTGEAQQIKASYFNCKLSWPFWTTNATICTYTIGTDVPSISNNKLKA